MLLFLAGLRPVRWFRLCFSLYEVAPPSIFRASIYVILNAVVMCLCKGETFRTYLLELFYSFGRMLTASHMLSHT